MCERSLQHMALRGQCRKVLPSALKKRGITHPRLSLRGKPSHMQSFVQNLVLSMGFFLPERKHFVVDALCCQRHTVASESLSGTCQDGMEVSEN